MVEEIGELELGDGLPEESLRSPTMVLNERVYLPRMVSWLSLYRVWGQGMYKKEGSSDRGVVSLREEPS